MLRIIFASLAVSFSFGCSGETIVPNAVASEDPKFIDGKDAWFLFAEFSENPAAAVKKYGESPIRFVIDAEVIETKGKTFIVKQATILPGGGSSRKPIDVQHIAVVFDSADGVSDLKAGQKYVIQGRYKSFENRKLILEKGTVVGPAPKK